MGLVQERLLATCARLMPETDRATPSAQTANCNHRPIETYIPSPRP